MIILISEIITVSRAISMRYAPRPLLCGQTLNLRKWERIRHTGFYADEINHFEANIDHVCVGTFPFNVGERQFYHDNGPFIDWQELNRIESACLKIYRNILGRTEGIRRLAFTLNGGAFE